MVVRPPDDQPVPGVVAADLVAVDDIDLLVARRASVDEQTQLARVVLRVAVGVKDPSFARGGEPGPQRPAVAAVARVMDHAQLRVMGGEFVQEFTGMVGAAVVDDDHLEIVRALAEGHQCRDDHGGNRPGVVESREKG